MIVSGGSSISVPMIESRRSVYVVWPGALTPPTELLKRVSPVNTDASPPANPPGAALGDPPCARPAPGVLGGRPPSHQEGEHSGGAPAAHARAHLRDALLP